MTIIKVKEGKEDTVEDKIQQKHKIPWERVQLILPSSSTDSTTFLINQNNNNNNNRIYIF